MAEVVAFKLMMMTMMSRYSYMRFIVIYDGRCKGVYRVTFSRTYNPCMLSFLVAFASHSRESLQEGKHICAFDAKRHGRGFSILSKGPCLECILIEANEIHER